MKKALISGITGQDDSYLAELLLEKGYQVHGIVRRPALEDPEHRLWRIRHILSKLILHPGSLENYASIFNVVERVKPDDYVIASGKTYSVKEFVELAFNYVDRDWKDYIVINERLYRPAEVYEYKR